MIAYHNDPKIKAEVLAQLAAHRLADEIIHGKYWENGKGCAVGCTIHSGNHVEYETRFGIPQMLAHIEDSIFEGMDNGNAKEWPERFMGAIKPGSDLSRVGWRFLHWILIDETVNPGITHPFVKDAVAGCAEIMAIMIRDGRVDGSAAKSAVASARSAVKSAWSAESAEWSASTWSESAWSAESAAWSARSAAWSASTWSESAWSAESAAWSVRSAAKSAVASARSAVKSASTWSESAWSASTWSEKSVAYSRMADKLVELLERQEGEK